MFLVFNEAKHILSWTFLKEGKFPEVQDILVELRDRHRDSKVSLKACFTTKCCQWRDELRQIFGKWFIVKGQWSFDFYFMGPWYCGTQCGISLSHRSGG